MNEERRDTIVIGAGQCGLAAAGRLVQRGNDVLVLEADARVGDVWRRRYDSLRLYSPAKYDALDGLPFPMPPDEYPTGRQMGDYLEAFATHFRVPVRTSARVGSLQRAGDGVGYRVETEDVVYQASNVIVASGVFSRPVVPGFASTLDPTIRQLHSSAYRGPADLVDGPVLVVGRGHSGADLAMEAVEHGHPTILSGRNHGELPWSVDSPTGRRMWPVMRFVAANVLTLRTPIGRRMSKVIRHGGAPLLRHRSAELRRAGVELAEAPTTGTEGGRPVLADGRVLDVRNVLWTTGFRPDFDWIRLPILDGDGWPIQDRGVVGSAPGLYFLGVIFQSGFTSMLVLGADRDAEWVVGHVLRRLGSAGRSASPSATARQAGGSQS